MTDEMKRLAALYGCEFLPDARGQLVGKLRSDVRTGLLWLTPLVEEAEHLAGSWTSPEAARNAARSICAGRCDGW